MAKKQFVFALIIMILSAGCLWTEGQAQDELIKAAKAGLMRFTRKLPGSQVGNYGFTDKKELQQAVLGEPFRAWDISFDKLSSYSEGQPIFEMIEPSDEWQFPVISQNKIGSLLTVGLFEGRWKATSFGKMPLARIWDEGLLQYPEEDGYEHRFVRSKDNKFTFIFLKDKDKSAILSCTDWLGLEAGRIYEPSYVLIKLKNYFSKYPPIPRDISADKGISTL